MELYPPCVSCVIRNVSRVAERVLPEDQVFFAFLRELLADFSSRMRGEDAAPLLTQRAYEILRSYSGVEDPYAREKEEFNALMLSLEEKYRALLQRAEDPLQAALVLTGSGNLIDFGAFDVVCPEALVQTLEKHMKETRLPSESTEAFFQELARRQKLLILGDNCGEIVLDKLLVEVLQQNFPKAEITVALRGSPALNDATLEDAHRVGLSEVTRVISSGSGAPGTPLEDCSREFVDFFEDSPLILSKGVGNFECAPLEDSRIFFLLVVKCDVLAQRLRKPLGSMLFFRKKESLRSHASSISQDSKGGFSRGS